MERLEVKKSGALKSYLLLVAALPKLDPAKRRDLETRARLGEPAALQALTESFMGLVVAEANALRGKGRRFEALIAAGNRGLARALRLDGSFSESRVRREVRRSLDAALERRAA